MLKYYNIVLRPPSELSAYLTKIAQNNFSGIAEGYCLSDSVFPHITLCQFKAENKPEVTFDTIKKSPQLLEVNLGFGQGQHEGYVWAEANVLQEAWLQHLHQYVKNKLSSHDVEILTQVYIPHLTFCRAKEDKVRKIEEALSTVKFESPVNDDTENWYIEMGHSDVNGQYLG